LFIATEDLSDNIGWIISVDDKTAWPQEVQNEIYDLLLE